MEIACPKCGNKDYFTLVLSYLRLSVERGPDGDCVARWDEGECGTACCRVCNAQLGLEQAGHLYAQSRIE